VARASKRALTIEADVHRIREMNLSSETFDKDSNLQK